MNFKNFLRFLLLCTILGLIVVFFLGDYNQYFSLEYIKQRQQDFANIYQTNKIITIVTFAILYVAITALSLPGAAVLTILAGVLFGTTIGVLIVSPASVIGATITFLLARFLFQDVINKKFPNQVKIINDGVKKDGALYLFILRLVPLFPFFMINILMGLTAIRIITFILVSFIGMLPGTFLYVYAGQSLSKITSTKDILSLEIIIAFSLIAIFPLLTKKLIVFFKAENFDSKLHMNNKFQKPKKFDYNVIVIGAGSAGLVASYIAAIIKAKVALIEKNKMGGDCLNTGCVPSKALIRSAKIMSYIKRAKEFGFTDGKLNFNFADIMNRVQQVIKKIEPHDSIYRYSKLGVDCISGSAKIISPYEVQIDKNKIITAKAIIVATGARPLVPNIPGLSKIDYLTSDNLWQLKKLPKKLLVLGGGPIGSEMAQSFARLGSNVTLIEMAPQILTREDEEVIQLVSKYFKDENINILTSHKAKEFIKKGNKKSLICEVNNKEVIIDFDAVIVALGRAANIDGFGLEELGIVINERKTISCNSFMQTNIPNIYVCGDVAGPYQFTHVAAHQAWYACINALFSPFKKFKVDYDIIAFATFTDPEVARVGLNEKEAKAQNIAYEVTIYGIDDLDRAIADSQDHGFVKILTKPNSDKILGVTIVGSHASDIITEYVLAMKYNIGLKQILKTMHIYPTLAEANKYAAGNWQKNHQPQLIIKLLEKFHKFRR
ncbi:MAG: dihydrolipoyl dehydrogenase [Rickettsiaceae bacterium]|nr:dihydrolipoyl dehydrogenase [Rickettsiaceae bacterium]